MDIRKSSLTNLKFYDRVRLQILKCIDNVVEQKTISERLKKWRSSGTEYALLGAAELTDEQISEIKKFWSRYSFVYPNISFNEFKAYMNRTGVFDCRYIPNGIRTLFIAPYLQNKNYFWNGQNKTLMLRTFPDIPQPTSIVHRINGYYYDGNYNRINFPKAINLCIEQLNKGNEIVCKPNDVSGGGRGVTFLKEADKLLLEEVFSKSGVTFVVQRAIKQHSEMARLNPNAVNTLRITSIIWKNKVVILAAALRIGTSDKRVDNWNAGGMIVGIDKDTGTTYSFGLDKKCNEILVTIGGVQLSDGFMVPFWEKVLETVEKAHHNIPYIKLASWDIAIDEKGVPTLIEVNFAGDWHVHQLTTGPVLGELTKEVLDKVILENYFKRHSTLDFDYKEYYDHVEVEKYVGRSRVVKIPSKKYGKPVTVIGKNAFRFNRYIEKIIFPQDLQVVNESAFLDCLHMKDIDYPKNVKILKSVYVIGNS